MATQTLSAGNGFLTSFNAETPRIYITAETNTAEEFDQVTLKRWQDEGFDVTFLPYGNGGQAYINKLKNISKTMGVGDRFGVIAFGDAAALALEAFRDPSPRLCALVAYYPSTIPDPQSSFPIGIKVLVHLAGGEVGVTRGHEFLGIQGRRRTVTRTIPHGTGTGGLLKLAFPSYNYEDVEPGFAEHDLDEYDKTAERIAWTRSLNTMLKAFKTEVELERIWEEHVDLEFKIRDAENTMTTMVSKPYVNHVPTLTGGVGYADLLRFYRDYFIPDNPPSLKMKLISRTIGVDKIVDELFVTFDHTNEISWMLPGVPATNKHVEVALVCVICIRGGKLYHEHIYWDQATVLVQIGLLDPKYIPPAMKDLGIKRLPVAGKESARKVLDEMSEPSNELLDDW